MKRLFGSLSGQINGIQVWESLQARSEIIKSPAFGTAALRSREKGSDYLTFLDKAGRAVSQN